MLLANCRAAVVLPATVLTSRDYKVHKHLTLRTTNGVNEPIHLVILAPPLPVHPVRTRHAGQPSSGVINDKWHAL